MSLRVLSPGTFSLVVDGGRPRSRRLGVAVGGPADPPAMAVANALVGNPPMVPALEIALSGPTLLAEADVGACVLGAPFEFWIDGEAVTVGQTFTLRRGQTLRIGATASACRAYLAVVGGFRCREVLDSQSAFDPVVSDDVLDCQPSTVPGRRLAEWPILDADPVVIRCLPGPQADWFEADLAVTTYRVSPAGNRMGLRLDGPPLSRPNREMVSEPVGPGAVQITNDGRPIILGVDGQTIGGYPKIAHVIGADLPKLGQLRPMASVRFAMVDEGEAEAVGAAARRELAILLRRIALANGALPSER